MNKEKPRSTAKNKYEEKKLQKQKTVSQNIPGAAIMRIALMICFVALTAMFYFQVELSYTIMLMLASIAAGIIYVMINKKAVITTTGGEKMGRFTLSYIISIIVIFFYAFAMYRSNQLNDFARICIILGSYFMFYCLYTASYGILRKLPGGIEDEKDIKRQQEADAIYAAEGEAIAAAKRKADAKIAKLSQKKDKDTEEI